VLIWLTSKASKELSARCVVRDLDGWSCLWHAQALLLVVTVDLLGDVVELPLHELTLALHTLRAIQSTTSWLNRRVWENAGHYYGTRGCC